MRRACRPGTNIESVGYRAGFLWMMSYIAPEDPRFTRDRQPDEAIHLITTSLINFWPTLATTGTAPLVVSQPGGEEEQHADIVRGGTVWRRRTRSRVPCAQECSLVVPLEFAGKRPILASRMSSHAPAIEVKCQRERKLRPTGKTVHVEQRSSGCARSGCLWPLAAWPFSFIRVRCFAGLKVMIFRKL